MLGNLEEAQRLVWCRFAFIFDLSNLHTSTICLMMTCPALAAPEGDSVGWQAMPLGRQFSPARASRVGISLAHELLQRQGTLTEVIAAKDLRQRVWSGPRRMPRKWRPRP